MASKFLALSVIFLIVPLTLYAKFEAVDGDRQAFLLRTLQQEGRLATQALQPALTRIGTKSLLDAAKALQSVAGEQVRIKLLLRPTGRDDAFFLVAGTPPLIVRDQNDLTVERDRLAQTGIVPHLDESCSGDRPLAIRYKSLSGQEELLTSISPLHTRMGCWLIITSYATDDLAASSLLRPFSEAPEVKTSMLFYTLMALLMVAAISGTLIDLRAFAKLARRIRQQGRTDSMSFAGTAAIPELLPVAREFDNMVATLDASSRALRETAEDNAHALKAPIAVITQALEPLRQCSSGGEPRTVQAIQSIEQALSRLGNLVNAARRLDEAAADLMEAKLHSIDLAALAKNMAEAYDRIHAPHGVRVIAKTAGPALVAGTEDSLETVIENLLDNAIGFSPENGSVRLEVALVSGNVRLTVEDDGPGVPKDQLGDIFRRNFSHRLQPQKYDDDPQAHFGIGLAVVRRNVELLGGEVRADTVPGAGLKVTVLLPAC